MRLVMTMRTMSMLLACAACAASAAPATLKPGEGYVALMYDTLQPLHSVSFNFNGKHDLVEVGGRYEAGRHLVVQALPAGKYCLEEFVAAGQRRTQNNPYRLCFDVIAGELAYGGTLMPRRYMTPEGMYDTILHLSDPLPMIERIEKEAPEVWATYHGAPERYAQDDIHNRNALLALGSVLDDNRAYKDARGYLTLAAKMGSGPAMERLGIQYLQGHGVDTDLAVAAKWFRDAADAGEARSAALLCIALDLGQGVAEDPAAALELCSRAAEREDAMGLWYLGSLLKRGRGADADPARASELQRKAEADQDFPAQMHWGYKIKKPDGSYPDPEGSYRIEKLALDRGLEAARGTVAFYTRKGIGVPANPAAAAELYVQWAKKGWTSGYFQAALIYARGDGVPRDAARCRALLEQYLDSGNTQAGNDVAWMLVTHPFDEIRDPKRALKLARTAVTREPDSAMRIDTLAAAYAELGRWDDAIEQQRKAVAILNRDGEREDVIKEYGARLDEYRAHTPHREKWD